MRKPSKLLVLAVLGLFLSAVKMSATSPHLRAGRTSDFGQGWELKSECEMNATGDQISTPGFKTSAWLRTGVPSSVLAAQVAAGQFKDPYVGTNLRDIAGTDYPIGSNFSNLPMSKDSPYACAWWYRKQFVLSAPAQGRSVWLHFGGINYRANIWINGKRIADSSEVAGAYRSYDFDVTSEVSGDEPNVVAVEVFAPTPTDLGINWVDWNPAPPDKDMGLWGPVSLGTSGPVEVSSPMVATHLTGDDQADLTIYAEVRNASDHPVHGVATADIAGIEVRQPIELAAQEQRTIAFDVQNYRQLHISHRQLWWPYEMGTPHLEDLTVRFQVNGAVSDTKSVRVGLREITSELTDKGYRLFRVNGKRILIRGGGWSQDMMLRENPARLEEQFRLVKDLHLNAIRLEGKMETQHFFDLADEQGILVMLGWCCCDQWEQWDKWTPENLNVATESLRSQMLRARNHPSAMVWLNGSDNPPPANVEKAYLDIEREMHWPNPTLSSASQAPTTVSGSSGVKMTGPYDFVAPSYWLTDTGKHGGAFGFNTETSPGPAIPTIASLHRFLPNNHIWPPDDTWSFHYGGEGFRKLDVFNSAMDNTYGAAKDLDDYEKVAQTMAYDGERAMFEAYGRNKYTSTGVIQWMLNNAWPSMIWHLYDFYLDAGGGYFGAKKACEPLHIQYSYDDHSVFVVNSLYQPAGHLTASAKVYDGALKMLHSQKESLDVSSDASARAFTIPDDVFSSDGQLHFVQLVLTRESGEIVSRNFYWVPASLTEFDWGKTDYTHTPASKYEDLKALRQLPPAEISASAELTGDSVRVVLRNPSRALAFQVAVTAMSAPDVDIAPILWSDNYIELLPGESRVLTAVRQPGNSERLNSVVVSGWNIQSQTLHPTSMRAVAQR